MGRRRARRKDKSIRNWICFALIAGIAIFIYIVYYLNAYVHPAVNGIAEIKAKAIISQIVNESINEEFQSEIDIDKLLLFQSDKEGKIELVQSNTNAMNLLVSELSKEIQDRYREMEPAEIEVPLGAILGSQLLSETGPFVSLRVLPISVSKGDFITEFETQGINQTKYKVYVTFVSQARILAPFSSNTIVVENTILIAEAIILGKVPQSYVNVPKEDILDATDEAPEDLAE